MISPNKRIRLSLLSVTTATIGVLTSAVAFAQSTSSDQLKSELLLGLMQPLPITVIGPLMASNLEIVEQGDVSSVTLERTMIMGALPLGDVTFDLKDLGDKRYQISNFKMPNMINLPGDMALKIGSSSLDGVWSFDTRSYETMSMKLNNVDLSVAGGAFQLGSVENLTLEIDQQGKSNIESSRLALTANGVNAEIPGQSKWKIGNVGVEVGTKTGEPLDMGSPFDFFGEQSAVDYKEITEQQKANRQLLQKVMLKHNFRNYPKEWWHFTLRWEPFPKTYFDFVVE